jgi:hypothetical protein
MPVDVGCSRMSFVTPWPLRGLVRGGTETELLRLAGWAVLCQMAATVAVGCLHQPAVQGGSAQPPELAELP